MIESDLVAAAYQGELPNGLSTLQTAQYWMLHRIYEIFRAGKLPKEDGQALKAMVLNYERLPKDERQNLLVSFLESWSKNYKAHFTAIKAISKQYAKEFL